MVGNKVNFVYLSLFYHKVPITSTIVNDEDVAVEEMEIQFPMDLDSEAVLRKDLKRISDTPTEVLEKEVEQEVLGEGEHDVVSGESSDSGQQSGHSSGAPLGSFVAQAVSFSPYVPLLNSILDSVQFDVRATSVIVPFGDLEIRVWEPKAAVDDSTLGTLPLEGMLKEIENLNSKRAGDIYTAEGIQELKTRNPKVQFRTITCRWNLLGRVLEPFVHESWSKM